MKKIKVIGFHKIALVCTTLELRTLKSEKNVLKNLVEPITYNIETSAILKENSVSNQDLQQLPQKIKHRKKRKFHS